MKKFKLAFTIGVLFLFVLTGTVLAQADGITIKLNRDFGYGGMGNQIQGTFSIVVKESGPFEKVTFMMDDVVLGEVTEKPYRWQFSTDSYSPGIHQYWASAVLLDGTSIESNRIDALVLSKEESNQGMFKILGITFGSIAVVGVISWIVSSSVAKKANTNQSFNGNELPQGFTTMGGSVCPKCGKPFSFHFWRLNLATHKVDRCPHCGKWVVVKSMTYQMMETMTKNKKRSIAVDSADHEVKQKKSDDDLKRHIDESKFMD